MSYLLLGHWLSALLLRCCLAARLRTVESGQRACLPWWMRPPSMWGEGEGFEYTPVETPEYVDRKYKVRRLLPQLWFAELAEAMWSGSRFSAIPVDNAWDEEPDYRQVRLRFGELWVVHAIECLETVTSGLPDWAIPDLLTATGRGPWLGPDDDPWPYFMWLDVQRTRLLKTLQRVRDPRPAELSAEEHRRQRINQLRSEFRSSLEARWDERRLNPKRWFDDILDRFWTYEDDRTAFALYRHELNQCPWMTVQTLECLEAIVRDRPAWATAAALGLASPERDNYFDNGNTDSLYAWLGGQVAQMRTAFDDELAQLRRLAGEKLARPRRYRQRKHR